MLCLWPSFVFGGCHNATMSFILCIIVLLPLHTWPLFCARPYGGGFFFPLSFPMESTPYFSSFFLVVVAVAATAINLLPRLFRDMREENLCGGVPLPHVAVPLVLQLADSLTPQSLRRVRLYVDLLANPPPPPHPFGTFLQEVSHLKAATPAAASVNPTESAEMEQKAATTTGGNEDKRDGKTDVNLPPLLGLLQRGYGHSSGTALHRVWVRYPKEYLSLMAQRIADLVLTRALPCILGHSRENPHNNTETTSHKNKALFASGADSRYDIHVRFLPSPSASSTVDASVSDVFCAEIIVRDVKTMQRIDEAVSLLWAQYMAVAAEGQTLQSALTFWRDVKGEAAVEEEGGSSFDGSLTGTVLGRNGDRAASKRSLISSAAEGGGCVWMQPPSKRPRYTVPLSSCTDRQRTATKSSLSESLKAPLQSAAGLVAVFYLAFSGTLYTGAAFRTPTKGGTPRTATFLEPDSDANGNERGVMPEKKVEEPTAPPSVGPVFFLPCTASTSFVRGLLGM